MEEFNKGDTIRSPYWAGAFEITRKTKWTDGTIIYGLQSGIHKRAMNAKRLEKLKAYKA